MMMMPMLVYLLMLNISGATSSPPTTNALVAEIPEGMLAYFEGQCLTPYWTELPKEYRGRLIVATNNTAYHGSVVGTIYSDGELRPHTHSFVEACMDAPMGTADSGVGGTHFYGFAQIGRYCVDNTLVNISSTAPSELPFAQFRLCAFSGNGIATDAPSTTPNKGYVIPSQTVAHFSPSTPDCPVGWSPYADSEGRFMMMSGYEVHGQANKDTPNVDTNSLVSNIGTHNHDFVLNTTVASRAQNQYTGYIPVEGELHYLATYPAFGIIDFYGNTSQNPLNVSYTQLLTCILDGSSGPSLRSWNTATDIWPSSEAMLFRDGGGLNNDGSYSQGCAEGWEEVEPDITGRFLVTVPANAKSGPNGDGSGLLYGNTLRITGLNDAKFGHTHLVYGNSTINDTAHTLNSTTGGSLIPINVTQELLCMQCPTVNDGTVFVSSGWYGCSSTPSMIQSGSYVLMPYFLSLTCSPQLVITNAPSESPTTGTPTTGFPTTTINPTTLKPSTEKPTAALTRLNVTVTPTSANGATKASQTNTNSIVIGALCDSRQGGQCCDTFDWGQGWASTGPKGSGFDNQIHDVGVCQSICTVQLPNYQLYATCIANCMSVDGASPLLTGPTYTPECAICFGNWGACEHLQCSDPCNGEGVRDSPACIQCDQNYGCDSNFTLCSGITNPRVDPNLAGEDNTQSENIISATVSTALGTAFLTSLAGVFAFRRINRRRKEKQQPPSQLLLQEPEVTGQIQTGKVITTSKQPKNKKKATKFPAIYLPALGTPAKNTLLTTAP